MMKRAIYTVAFLFFLGAWIGCSDAQESSEEQSAMPAVTPASTEASAPTVDAQTGLSEEQSAMPVATPASTEASAPTADAQTGFSDKEMVDRHNHWRSEVGAPNLRWSEFLATYAQAWADSLAKEGCAMMHRNQDQYGENLKWAGARRSRSGRRFLQTVTPTEVVDEWAGERQWYDYDTNRCQTGQDCGHYTQMVWAKTREVGCGRTVCTDKSQVWVCNYSPPGNIVGEKPY